jgi:hypothetical protein
MSRPPLFAAFARGGKLAAARLHRSIRAAAFLPQRLLAAVTDGLPMVSLRAHGGGSVWKRLPWLTEAPASCLKLASTAIRFAAAFDTTRRCAD